MNNPNDCEPCECEICLNKSWDVSEQTVRVDNILMKNATVCYSCLDEKFICFCCKELNYVGKLDVVYRTNENPIKTYCDDCVDAITDRLHRIKSVISLDYCTHN